MFRFARIVVVVAVLLLVQLLPPIALGDSPDGPHSGRSLIFPPSLTIELEPTGEIICKKDEGKLVLPVEVKVTNQRAAALNGVKVEVQVEGFVLDKEEVSFGSLAPSASATKKVNLPVAHYVQSTKNDGLLDALKLVAKGSTATDSNAASALKQVDNARLQNPQQYVQNVLKDKDKDQGSNLEKENAYWRDRTQLSATGQPITIAARFGPQCGNVATDQVIDNNGVRMPIKTLAKALDPAMDHFNWLQTITFPQNWLDHLYTIPLVDRGRIGISCKRFGKPVNALLYSDTLLPVNNKTLMNSPFYDPPVADASGARVYLFGVDGPEEDDLCWSSWELHPDAGDNQKPYISQSDMLSLYDDYRIGFNDAPEQEKWTLVYREKNDSDTSTNQFIRFETRLVGVKANEELVPGALYDGFTWKSNTVNTKEGGISFFVRTVQATSGQNLTTDPAELEGGIFDVGPLNSDNSLYLPFILR